MRIHITTIILLCVFAARAQAQATSQPTADELVRAVRENDRWIHDVKSFYVKFDAGWSKSPEAIERRKAELKRENPNDDLDIKRRPELLPERQQMLILAFDKNRLYKYEHDPVGSKSTAFWDGSRLFWHTKYFSHDQEQQSISPTPDNLGGSFFTSISWQRTGEGDFWWTPMENRRRPGSTVDGWDRWEVAGREMWHGVDCWVLERAPNLCRWYVGVERPLLHGIMNYHVPKWSSARDDVRREMAQARQLPEIESSEGFDAWMKSLSKEEHLKAFIDMSTRLRPRAEPWGVHRLLDYKEVSPGRWFPMTQGYDNYDYDTAPQIISSTRSLRAVEVKVDEPLPDEMFKMKFVEGVKLYDRSQDPPLHYTYKTQFTPEEWQKILNEAKERQARSDKMKAESNALLGKPAPAFPAKCEWLNSEALSWESLKGKVVVVDFFADWCGPCQNVYPTLAQLYKDRQTLPFIVIGVHPPGSARASVDKLIKDFGLALPICIDVPQAGAWGELFAAYQVKSIPQAVVVDAGGNIAGHGSLGAMTAKARELSQPKQAVPTTRAAGDSGVSH